MHTEHIINTEMRNKTNVFVPNVGNKFHNNLLANYCLRQITGYFRLFKYGFQPPSSANMVISVPHGR